MARAAVRRLVMCESQWIFRLFREPSLQRSPTLKGRAGHGVDEQGVAMLRKQVRPYRFLSITANMESF
jgi:hypothetical protein